MLAQALAKRQRFASLAMVLHKFAERIPLGRGAEAAEIADAIAFLASVDARFVTGVNLPVDGGLSASTGQPKLA